ncbi:helix-turn-helix domain-containing protein [Chloroflexi bacterium TSY]|nr:helix-turn-helix domain-containing protein [Chloroflexi bacterium TSY]
MSKRLPVTEKFGHRIRVLRKERGLSQEQLAERSGLDRTYISGIERGVRNVALRNIEALAQALNVSISDLFENI